MTGLFALMGILLLSAVIGRILERSGRGKLAAILDLGIAAAVLFMVCRWVMDMIVNITTTFHLIN